MGRLDRIPQPKFNTKEQSDFFNNMQAQFSDPASNPALGGPGGIVGSTAVRSLLPLGQKAKDLVKGMLMKNFTDKATDFAFRGTSIGELQEIAKRGILPIGQSAEGVPGISAANITREGFPVYGEGVGFVTKAGQFSPSGRFGEVLVNEKTDPRELQFVIGDKLHTFDELKKLFK